MGGFGANLEGSARGRIEDYTAGQGSFRDLSGGLIRGRRGFLARSTRAEEKDQKRPAAAAARGTTYRPGRRRKRRPAPTLNVPGGAARSRGAAAARMKSGIFE